MPRKQPPRLVTARSRKGIGGRPRGAPTAVIRLPLPVAALAWQHEANHPDQINLGGSGWFASPCAAAGLINFGVATVP
jgi:hypothetical protein